MRFQRDATRFNLDLIEKARLFLLRRLRWEPPRTSGLYTMAHPAYLPSGITPEMYERTRESLRRYLAGQDRVLLARCLSEAQSPPTPCMTHSTSPVEVSASEDSADDDTDSLAPLLAAATAAHQYHHHRPPASSTATIPSTGAIHQAPTPTKPRLASNQPMDFGIVPSTPAPENILPGTPPGRKGIMDRVLDNADYLDSHPNNSNNNNNLSDSSNDSEYDYSQHHDLNAVRFILFFSCNRKALIQFNSPLPPHFV